MLKIIINKRSEAKILVLRDWESTALEDLPVLPSKKNELKRQKPEAVLWAADC